MDVQLPNGSILRGVPDGTNKQQIAEKLKTNGVEVPADWLAPPKQEEFKGVKGVMEEAISEPFMHAVTGAGAGLAGGLAYAGGLATGDTDRAKRWQEATQNALTYQPKSSTGQAVSSVAEYPFRKLGEAADAAGEKVAATTGSPALGAATNVGINLLPAAVGKGAGMLRAGMRAEEGAAAASAGTPKPTPESRAYGYISRNTSLDWSALPDAFKKTLTTIAQDATALDKLDPKAVERQARLAGLKLPATRGQVTRDLSQLTREENLTKSDAGAPIREINAEQDRILHEHLDTLRGETGGKAATRQQVGQSVQGATRAKLDSLRGDYQTAYKAAKESGAGLEPADISDLKQWLKNPTNRRNAPYLQKAISDYEKRGEKGKFIPKDHVSINNLEEIRKEATANTKKPGPEGHFAKEAVRVIDDILDKSGSDVYKDARSKYKAVKEEFDRQGRVAGLVKNKGFTKDRAVALEDTFDNVVLKGSTEQLRGVQETLTKGGSDKTRAMGTQAWKDLQAATIDYLKDKAAGKRAIPGEKNQLQFNSTFLDALYDLDKDGKIDTLFGPGTSAKLREMAQATRDVRTKPTGRISGSDTAPRLLNFLEKLAAVPVVGKYAAGAAKVVGKVASMGSDTREAGRAKTSPLDEAATASDKSARQDVRRRNTLKGIETRAGASTLTLRDDQT